MVKRTVTLVEWADAHGATDSWTPISDLETDGEVVIFSVGFLLPVEEGGRNLHVTLVQSFDDDHVDNVLNIPVGMVRKITDIGSFNICSDTRHQ